MPNTTPQPALLISDLELRAIYEKHQLATADIVISDLRRILIDAQAAILAKLQATQEPVQAGELPDEREAFEQFAQNCPMGKYNITRREDGYDSSHTQIMWDAWQARVALSARNLSCKPDLAES
jgi:hypothetical protein